MSQSSSGLYRLYHSPAGRSFLKILTAPPLSRAAGAFLDTRASVCLIPPFVSHAGICLSDYEQRSFHSFNDFFTRHLAPGVRTVDHTPDALIAPCDGNLSVYPIRQGMVIPVKGVPYSIAGLLRSQALANRFEGGLCLVFRLCVDHYHRYAFFDTGRLLRSYHIPGILHTVRPVALESHPVFIENTRSVSLMRTCHFGLAVQVEVGAMLVGRIHNHAGVTHFVRGEEKGYFEYGGSTIVLLLQRDAVIPDTRFPLGGAERSVQFGEAIGYAPSGGFCSQKGSCTLHASKTQ